jgi:hypothetical protein
MDFFKKFDANKMMEKMKKDADEALKAAGKAYENAHVDEKLKKLAEKAALEMDKASKEIEKAKADPKYNETLSRFTAGMNFGKSSSSAGKSIPPPSAAECHISVVFPKLLGMI